MLRDEMQTKGITLLKLRQQTGIAERYLSAFLEDESGKLPASPYVRGYLFRIASVLELDGNALWESYKASSELKSSGAEDRMPENRFALKRINRKMIFWVGVAIVAVAYLGTNANRFLGKPDLVLTSPSTETSVTTASIVMISGMIKPGNIVSVGGEEVVVGSDGKFETAYHLEPGLNQITIFTENPVIGRKNEITRQVIYEPASEPPAPEEVIENGN